MPGNLDTSLLLGIMRVMADQREDSYPRGVSAEEFAIELIPSASGTEGEFGAATISIERHIAFLIEAGYLRISSARTVMLTQAYGLTYKGQTFVQPELLEFGDHPLLPMVIQSLEDRIQVLTYPEEEKNGMLLRLRGALADKAPDFLAKVIAEIGFKIMTGGKP